MKKKLICLFYLLSFFIPCSFSQTITLKVDKKCNSFIMLDNENLVNQGVYHLALNPGQSIQFQLLNPSKKKIVISIKGEEPATNIFIKNFQDIMEKVNPVSTDNNLNIDVDDKRTNLKKPFRIYLGCNENTAETVYVTFIPVFGNQNNGSPASKVSSNSLPDINEMASDDAGNEHAYMPGAAVYDALKLADNKNLSEYEYKKIIKFYFPAEEIDDTAKANAAARKNPFLKKVIDSKYTVKQTDKSIAESGNEILSGLSLSSIGGLDVTNLADGLAKFVVKRTKEELSIAFFKRFKNTIDSIPDLQTLFPATANLLSSIESEVYDYKKYIQNLREAFKADIQALDENLPGIIDNHPALFARYPALAVSLRSGCYITGELKRQVHPGDILANYPLDIMDRAGISKNYPGAIQTIQLLSASLRDTASTDSNYWVNIKYLRQLVNDKRALQIYFGLLYQKALNDFDSVQFQNTSLVQLLDTLAEHYNEYNDYYRSYKLYIMRFAEKTDALNKMIKNYTKPANDSLALELYKKYFDASIDLVEYATQVGQLPFINRIKFLEHLHDTLAVYFDISHATSDLVIDINRKNYSSAINRAIYIYGEIRTKPSKAEALAMRTSANSNASRRSLQPAVDSLNRSEIALNMFVKYGGFMATVATAKNSNEVEAAIEAFALPTGSASIKRQSPFNVSLNVYAGLFTGFEKIRGVDDKFKINSYGVTVPVGIAVSKGHSVLFIPVKWGCSSSVFISLIDIGAVAAYRFKDDTTVSKLPTIQLKDIVSPGIFYSQGFGKTPLSLNLGWQAGPVLRKVGLKENEFGKAYSRFSISLCVDIPLLNFYTKSK